ncbi:uncharacterized protein LOC126718868 [Quercus robur]|uniref:uncharacterized protein LOC126718868 n=1 Tax=Quercus robur TaxID=38942 RepID=UPI002162A13B|nr:uncharacterized protein LOC126718868 [Quercus robur]
MSQLGFSLFRISIKRTGLRNISGVLSLRCFFSCPSSAELNPSPFRLLGPPEISHSTVNATPGLVDTQDFFSDEKLLREKCYLRSRDPCFQFYEKRRKIKAVDSLVNYLENSWYHCPHTTLKLICLLRNTSYFGNLRREEFFVAAMWLHQYHPKTLACNVKTFAKFGCLKDLLEILCRIVNSGIPKHTYIMDSEGLERREGISRRIKKNMRSKILIRIKMRRKNMKVVKDKTKTKKEKSTYLRMVKRNMMLKEDFEKRLKALKDRTNAEKMRKEKINMMVKKAIRRYNYDKNYRFLYDRISDLFAKLLKADLEHLNSGQTAKISLASKWCPSLYSSYDYSTLFCESVARRLFPYDSCPEYKGINEAHYVYRVRNRLQKEVLVPLRKALELPEIYMSANQWNLLPYDRISSVAFKTYKRAFYKHDRERFLQYLQNVQCLEMPKTTAKDLLPHEILKLFQYANGHEVAELQWKRMLDAFSKNGKFVNCISTFNSNDWTDEFCCGFTLMTSELCASPWKGKVLKYSDNPEVVSIKGDDLQSRINFCRLNNVVSPKGDGNDTKPWGLLLLSFLDKILETAIDLNVRKQDMIKRVFMFEGKRPNCASSCHYESCCGDHDCGWRKNYEAMKEKFEVNGYVMPQITHWEWDMTCMSKFGLKYPEVISFEGGLTHIRGLFKTSFRFFVEGDGTLNLRAMMDSEICSADDPELLVHD